MCLHDALIKVFSQKDGKISAWLFLPFFIIDMMAKLSERLNCTRLDNHLEKESPGLSDNHFGIRKHRSTIDAFRKLTGIATKAIERTITLDVKNTFKCA